MRPERRAVLALSLAAALAAPGARAQNLGEAQELLKQKEAAASAKKKADAERLAAIQFETNEKDWQTPPEKPARMPNPCAKATDAEDAEAGLLPTECAGKTTGQIVIKEIGYNWMGNGKKIWVEKLDGQFLLKPQLAVASIYAEGSCPYKFTLEHEKLHWDDYRRIYAIVLERVKKLVVDTEFPTKSAPHELQQGETVESFRAPFDRSLAEILKEWRGRLKFAAGKATLKRDSDEGEAAKRENACGSEWSGRKI